MGWFKKSSPVTVNIDLPIGWSSNYGVAPTIQRTDGTVTLTVGCSYVMLSPSEAEVLARALIEFSAAATKNEGKAA